MKKFFLEFKEEMHPILKSIYFWLFGGGLLILVSIRELITNRFPKLEPIFQIVNKYSLLIVVILILLSFIGTFYKMWTKKDLKFSEMNLLAKKGSFGFRSSGMTNSNGRTYHSTQVFTAQIVFSNPTENQATVTDINFTPVKDLEDIGSFRLKLNHLSSDGFNGRSTNCPFHVGRGTAVLYIEVEIEIKCSSEELRDAVVSKLRNFSTLGFLETQLEEVASSRRIELPLMCSA